MGAKDSKRACLNYEDAVKKISDAELRRLCEAFKRLSGGNTSSGGLLSVGIFTQHVLGEGTPATVANCLYSACGGTQRGIAFKELVCGLVLLTKGTQEEKIKFLWTLYSNDSGTHICRSDFQRALQLEGPPGKSNCLGRWPERTVISLFGVGQDRVTFEHFRAWITYNREATVLSSWLLVYPSVSLTTEIETPTFYQTLAGVTHLEETDICELEKSFWLLQGSGNSGQLDLACLSQLVSPPVPASLCAGLFRAFDANGDGHVDFKELCCGISAACRGPAAERLKFCFRMLDEDRDGVLADDELHSALDAIALVWKEAHGNNNDSFYNLTPALNALQSKLSSDGSLAQEDFLLWALDGEGAEVSAPLLELLFQVCHVALGLRPRCRHHEREIALGWLDREQRRGYRVGQFWYLVGASWWRNWQTYTSAPPSLGERCGCKQTMTDKDISPSSTIAEDEDACSLASSSGVSSGGSASGGSRRAPGTAVSLVPPQPPGPVDNTALVCEWPAGNRVPTLTGEGGCLRRDTPLVQHRDFELVPDSLWKALQQWYGGPLPLPRQVITSGDRGEPPFDIELYPLSLRILRHIQPAAASAPGGGSATAWGGVVGGYGAAAASLAPAAAAAAAGLRRYLAHTAAFSRLATVRQVCEFLAARLGLRTDELRIWHCPSDSGAPATLLDDEIATLQQAGLADGDQILLEVRNKDLTWPEELGALLDVGQGGRSRSTVAAIHTPPPGATGLHNLGNTCFMNAALQAVSNTRALTQYFRIDNGRLRELNPSNPLGTRGQVARRYAELCRELWAGGGARSVAPLRMRWCVTRHAPHLGGGGQHDSQELLAWLLDALHEDLNRSPASTGAGGSRSSELRDSDGRPDAEVADEAWKVHLVRDHSIITDLFYGQLKSKVTCQSCGHESVRFDPFNLLSLPLPMEESCTLCETLVIRLDGEMPVKYAVRLGGDARIGELRKRLASMSCVPVSRLCLAEVVDSQVRRLLSDGARLSTCAAVPPLELTAYEIEEDTPELLPNHSLSDESNEVNGSELAGDDEPEELTRPIARSPEVSATSALCMPNILCFKTGEQAVLEAVQQRNRRRRDSPDTEPMQNGPSGPGYVVAVHRKSVRQDIYLLSQHKWRPTLFGVPLLLGRRRDMTCRKLYSHIARQVARLLSPSPPNGSQSGQGNHAADCDDSLGYGFPFTLRTVAAGGRICASCPWTRFCRGCEIKCTDELVPWESVIERDTCDRWVAIDWEPTALHLRYQSGRERAFLEHESVAFCRKRHTEPIDLDYCLRVFTSEEKLEAHYHCSGCRSKQPATKKLQIWRLPPILIIHLKRFDFANGKWVKTQKAVNFPFDQFDPTPYLASVPQETILRHKQLKEDEKQLHLDEEINKAKGGTNSSTRERLESTSLLRTPVIDEDLRDFHEHHLKENQDPLDISYRLYAVVSHSGMLNGGHYIAYACNPNNSWYCYNDSSCREVTSGPIGGDVSVAHPTPRIDTSSAYILFYERKGLDYAPYLPRSVPGDDHATAVDTDDDCDNDLRKQLCLLS